MQKLRGHSFITFTEPDKDSDSVQSILKLLPEPARGMAQGLLDTIEEERMLGPNETK